MTMAHFGRNILQAHLPCIININGCDRQCLFTVITVFVVVGVVNIVLLLLSSLSQQYESNQN
jgi:general stress protein CsbA